MKKEYLTLQDRKEMRAKSKSMSVLYLTLSVFGSLGWWIYQYYFANEKYTITSICLLIAVIVGMFVSWVIHSLEEWQHYKWVVEGKIKDKQKRSDTENTYYIFKIGEEDITISKENFDKYKVGQKVKIEKTAITKSTIRITEI